MFCGPFVISPEIFVTLGFWARGSQPSSLEIRVMRPGQVLLVTLRRHGTRAMSGR
jgi:hypothetical protein